MLQTLCKTVWHFLKRLNAYDAASLFFGIYPKEMKHTHKKHLCTNVCVLNSKTLKLEINFSIHHVCMCECECVRGGEQD